MRAPDRGMRLIEAFTFIDHDGVRWTAPAGSLIDGASIPRALWTLIGSPYTDRYRRASIVHDVACVEAGQSPTRRKLADHMFYRACRAGGCSVRQATLLYLGVRIGAWSPVVEAWREATSVDPGARLELSESEVRLIRDFTAGAAAVLEPGEIDDPEEIERRAVSAFSTMLNVPERALSDAAAGTP